MANSQFASGLFTLNEDQIPSARPNRKARRPRIPGVFKGRSNAARRDRPAERRSLISVNRPLV